MAGSRFSLIFQDEEGTAPETVVEPIKTTSKAPKHASSKSTVSQAGKSTLATATTTQGKVHTMDASAAGGSLSALSLYLKAKVEEKKNAAAAATAAAATRQASSTIPVAVTDALLSAKPSSQSRPLASFKKGEPGVVSYDRHSRSGPSNSRRHKGDDNLAQLMSTAVELDTAVPAMAEYAETSPTAALPEPVPQSEPSVEVKPVPLMTLDQYLAERAKNAITLQPAIRVPEKAVGASGWIPLRPTETQEEAYYVNICRNAAASVPRSKNRPSNTGASVPKLTVDPRLNIDYSTGPRPKSTSTPGKFSSSKTASGHAQTARPPRSSFHSAKKTTQTTTTTVA